MEITLEDIVFFYKTWRFFFFFYKILGVGYVFYGLPETARRVLESTGMAHCAIPNTNSSLQASLKGSTAKKSKFIHDYK